MKAGRNSTKILRLREYVLTCDNDIFYLNQYELSNQMIKDALEGVANGTYDIIAVRPSNLDDQCISYFIERGKGKNLHIRLYITTEDDIGDESYMALNGILAT